MQLNPPARYLPPVHAESLFRAAKKSAQQRGIEFDLTVNDITVMLERAGGRCEVSGLEFSDLAFPGATRRPWSPSLDRVVSNQGYSPSNCRIVVAAVNLALNEWGDEVLLTIASALADRNQLAQVHQTLWLNRTEISELEAAIVTGIQCSEMSIVQMFRVKGAPDWFRLAVENGCLVPAAEQVNCQQRGRGSRANASRTAYYKLSAVVEFLDSLGTPYQSRLLSMKKSAVKQTLREADTLDREIQRLRKKRATLLAKARHLAEAHLQSATG
jgi:hypothetical protein